MIRETRPSDSAGRVGATVAADQAQKPVASTRRTRVDHRAVRRPDDPLQRELHGQERVPARLLMLRANSRTAEAVRGDIDHGVRKQGGAAARCRDELDVRQVRPSTATMRASAWFRLPRMPTTPMISRERVMSGSVTGQLGVPEDGCPQFGTGRRCCLSLLRLDRNHRYAYL